MIRSNLSRIFLSIFLGGSILIFLLQRTYVMPGVIKYYDEFYSVLFVPLLVFRIFKVPTKTYDVFKKNKYKILILMSILLFAGIVGNFVCQYQEIKYLVIDVISVFKFFFAIGTTCLILEWVSMTEKFKVNILIILKIFTVIMLTLTFFEYCFSVFQSYVEYRYGLKSISLFYEHYTYYGASMYLCGTIIVLLSKSKRDLLYAVICFLLSMLNLRAKNIISVFVAFGLIYIVNFKEMSTKQKVATLTLFGGLFLFVFALGFNTVKYYFVDITDSARSVLSKTSIEIAKNMFPFGAGFGSFGSNSSATNYSSIYYDYKISHIYGLGPTNTSFISDAFWPMILGQTGVLGCCSYVALLGILISQIFKSREKKYFLASAFGMAYLLISSTSESAFANSLGVCYAVVISMALVMDERKKQIKVNCGGILE